MKIKHQDTIDSSSTQSSVEEEPFYSHVGWVEPALKHAAAQEERRGSRHSGKTIKRPERVTRTMAT